MLHPKRLAQTVCSDRVLRHSKIFVAGTVIAMSVLGTYSIPKPVLANSHHQKIVHKMSALQQSQQRWIEINISTQRLIAWQGKKQVYAVTVSTGKASTPTYPGVFKIQRKHSTDRMRGSNYDVPDVPYTMYYHRGYAIHGAYWHNSFGTPVSHGCTNLPVKDAEWLYQWASVGTPIIIHH